MSEQEGEERDVAIYHLSTKPVSRGKGRSATAAIAYRAGDLVHDLTTDQVFDYTRKRGIEHSEIVLPDFAAKADINWARDRQALWNAAEMTEKRRDARVAREYEVALPHELTREQRVALVREFSAELANRYGVAVDFAIHAPHRAGDERNHHAHILTTTRQVTAIGLGDKASIEWSDTDRAKKGLGAAKVEVKAIRERWAVLTNEHLKERGLDVRIDHRSLEAQGIERVPTSHLGPAVSAMERRGIETEVGKRISLEMATQRLAQAAELGRIERERAQVQRSILDLSGDLKAAQQEGGLVLDRPQKRGRFEGLKLDAGRVPVAPEIPSAPPDRAPDRVALELQRSVDRYARAWVDAMQMHAKKLPALEHQKIELKEAGAELDKLRPGMSRDINMSVRYEPKVRQAMTELQGPERAVGLIAGAVHEARIRKDPHLRAERLVKEWNGLEGRREQLKGSEHAKERERVVGQVRELALEVKQSPELEAALKGRGRALGIALGSRLSRVIEEPDLKRALSISERELSRGFNLGLGM